MAKKKIQQKKRFRHILPIALSILVVILIIGLIHQHNPHIFRTPLNKVNEILSPQKENKKPTTVSPAEIPENKKKREEKTTPSQSKPASPLPPAPAASKKQESVDLRKIKGLTNPVLLTDRPEQIITHTGYTVSYNSKWKVANWVGYELTRTETGGEEKRTNKFVTDPQVKGASATDSDYRGSGYDRGHLAPAADMAWSPVAMKESFYFSNMTPQAPNLNRGIWKSLEDKVRKWADRDSAIIIICGPVMNDTSKTIGKNKVLVPASFYKVILSPYGKTPKAIGFLFKNEGSLQTLDSFAVSVDSIEKLTGIDFFYQLPDSLESRIEGSFQLNQWF
ncbi:MAG: DNA/RNA non-specific endonuclease [Bacteroidales bacterium]